MIEDRLSPYPHSAEGAVHGEGVIKNWISNSGSKTLFELQRSHAITNRNTREDLSLRYRGSTQQRLESTSDAGLLGGWRWARALLGGSGGTNEGVGGAIP